MKPNFALTFSSDGIRLLHRAPNGWLLVGDAPFDAADMAQETAALLAKAALLDSQPIRTKLVIPNDQIRYLSVASTARTEAEAEDDAAHALRGATPYELKDLAFDWAMDDGQLYLAAVARETLDEAEGFAVEHGFNPVSFVALPDQSTFAGEPFFGVAKSARAALPKPDGVTRDLQPIQVVGAAAIPAPPTPDPKPTPAPKPEPKPDPKPAQKAGAQPKPAPKPPEAQTAKPSAPPKAIAPDTGAEGDATPAFASVRKAPTAAKPGPETVTHPAVPDDLSKAPKPSPDAPPEKPTAKAKPAPVSAIPPAPGAAPIEAAATRARTEPPAKTASLRLGLPGKRAAAPPSGGIGGKPRYLGVALSGILLFFLAVAAVWASLGGTEDAPETAIAPIEAPAETELAETPPLPPAEEATVEELAEADDVEPAGNVTEGEAALPPSPAQLLPDTPHPVTPQEAEQHYLTTGIWQIAPDQPQPPEIDAGEEAYLVSLDPRSNAVDAVALPDIGAQHDNPPARRVNPAAAGTTFDVDDRGLVTATPEGALTPDGIMVFLGQPPLTPPKTPTRFSQTPDPAASAIGGIRPRARPGNLLEKTEREQLGGRTRTELAALRPRVRPIEEKEQIEQAAPATQQAVLNSLKPRPRPGNMSKIVEKTEQKQKATVQTAAAVAPVAVIPSKASVARQATVKDALDLRQVNLIGVYGKPSDRRALVRLSNGRYKKVQVGDSIDGGKVAAIGETELRYVKGGRAIVLKMPRG
ncbi:hypothetical protein [Thalassovita sp.]|uniref:hypothetical protein n=1 Tax=Thalassovita sp. TaxID=1979401 RepID=UPI0029DE869D|nr:hypothetical protein [Thalassovita sp.]